MIRLVVTDLDGTIVPASGQISPRVHAAFSACQTAGIGLCVATGRIRQAALQVGQRYTICHGGSLLFEGERSLLRNTVPAEQIRAVWGWAKERELPAVFFGEERWATAHQGQDVTDLSRFLRLEPDAEPAWDAPLSRVKTTAAELATAFPHLHLEQEGDWTYLRHSPADKGIALRHLMEQLGLSPEQVICFGDELNDLPMFSVAGHAVAVANGRPELKAVATRVAPSVDEDGVAIILEEILASA